MNLTKYTAIGCIVVCIVLIAAIIHCNNKQQVNDNITVAIISDSDKELDLWIEKLADKENCPPNGMIDINGKISRGRFCFQEKTYIHYSKKYQVYNDKDLVKKMIKDDYNNYKHWLCSCVQSTRCPKYTWKSVIGLPPKI